jgi:hypothetical protein
VLGSAWSTPTSSVSGLGGELLELNVWCQCVCALFFVTGSVFRGQAPEHAGAGSCGRAL